MNNFQRYHLGAKAVIFNTKGEILLLRLDPKEMKLKKDENYWDFPGGRTLEDESVEDCLRRRLKAEVNLEVTIMENLGLVITNVSVNDNTDTQSAKLILQVFLCKQSDNSPLKVSSEFIESGWFDPHQASQLLKVKYPENFSDKFISPKKIESHSGKIVQVVIEQVSHTKNGNDITRVFEQARRSPGTRILVVSPDQKILLTKEFRHDLQVYDYRIPGGKVFDSLEEYLHFLKSGQDILPVAVEAGKREAREELGIEISQIDFFYKSVVGSTFEWDLYYLIAKEYHQLNSQELGLGEDIQLSWFSFEDAKEMALSGQMSEDRSAAVLLRYLHQSTQK